MAVASEAALAALAATAAGAEVPGYEGAVALAAFLGIGPRIAAPVPREVAPDVTSSCMTFACTYLRRASLRVGVGARSPPAAFPEPSALIPPASMRRKSQHAPWKIKASSEPHLASLR